MDDSCGVGEGLNCFKVWVYLHLMYWWGDISQHSCMRNLPNILCLLGDNSFLGLILQKLLYVWAQVLCIHVLVCVCVCVRAQRSYLPAMPKLSFDSRKEYIHVLLLHRLEGIALVCQAVKDNELPLLKRREGCLKSYLSINICSEL